MQKYLPFLLILFCSTILVAQEYISGYHKTLSGEELQYHAPQPDAEKALLIRSEDESRIISWETDPVPKHYNSDTLHFLLLAGMDVNAEDPHSWIVFLNDKKYFTIKTPRDTLRPDIVFESHAHGSLTFKTEQIDKYGDLMGYLTLSLPKKDFEAGKPVQIKVSGEQAKSQTWFMVFKYHSKNYVNITAENAIRKSKEGPRRIIKTETIYYGKPQTASFTIDGNQFTKELNFGYNVFYDEIPAISRVKTINAEVSVYGDTLFKSTLTLNPVKQMDIYLLHHSHVDIGYTHLQKEVEHMQWKFLDQAITLAEESQDYPVGSRFKWNSEVMWAVDSYLKQASPEQKKKLRQAIANGFIEVNGMYANELTALCSQEELFLLFSPTKTLNGQVRTSAMISDIAGCTWAVIPAMAQNGIRYFSMATNRGHRIGNILGEYADNPFYWISASGQDSVLTWIHGEGYSMFHTGLGSTNIPDHLTEENILPYMNTLAREKYPYDMTILRYNIGSDNGPPDDELCKKVMRWNETYESPKLIISTTSEAFSTFEAKYGGEIPVVGGDMTGYWEDGAASSASETALNRHNASALSNAATLFAMLNPSKYSSGEFENAWQKVLLYNEHTWGSWNSISEPQAPFTLEQWKTKSAFAFDAAETADKLTKLALDNRRSENALNEISLEVINTNSWTRSDWVKIPDYINMEKYTIVTSRNKTVALKQIDLSADKAGRENTFFYAEEVPAFGSKIFKLLPSGEKLTKPTRNEKMKFENKKFSIEIDKNTGSISSFYVKDKKFELVDKSTGYGLNQYLYTKGRNPKESLMSKLLDIKIIGENTVVLKLDAPGCTNLQTTLCLDDDRLLITNTLVKKKNYDPEALRFAFPFLMSDATLRYDLAFAQCIPELDQMANANRNFITINNSVNISNKNFGISWCSPDAPLIEVGKMRNDPVELGYEKFLEPSTNFYSYVMNNYWETNYLAAQEGEVTIRYEIRLNDHGYNPAQDKKAGIEARQPLTVIPVNTDQVAIEAFFEIDNPNIISFSAKPVKEGILISVFNCSAQDETLKIPRMDNRCFLSDFGATKKIAASKRIVIPGNGIRHLLVMDKGKAAGAGRSSESFKKMDDFK